MYISIQGDINNIIYPIDTYSSEIYSLNSNTNSYNKADYDLVNENMDYGVKLYSRLINGIPTDDYYLEFYNNNKLVGIYKSSYTLSDSLIESIMDNPVYVENVKPITNHQINPTLSYTYIDGELRLIEKRIVVTRIEELSYIDYLFYDVETDEVVYL